MKRGKRKFLQTLIALIICLFCSFSAVGCIVPGGSNSGKGSDRVPGGGVPPTRPSPDSYGPTPSEPDVGDIVGSGPNISDYNTVFAGAVAVYETEQDNPIFYDKYKNANMSFKDLIDRQFDTMASYLVDTLTKIYGTTMAAGSGSISGFKSGVISYNYSDTISNNTQKILAGLGTGGITNQETLNYTNAINGGYRINKTEDVYTDPDTGEDITEYNFDGYSTELVTANAWYRASKFNDSTAKDYVKQSLMDIYATYEDINTDTSQTFSFTNAHLLQVKYSTYNPTYPGNSAYDQITKLGLTEKFLWNVAYFIAYDVIGETNLFNSIDHKADIFNGGSIRSLNFIAPEDLDLFTFYQNYKGYDEIIKEIVWNMAKLAVPTSGTISFNSSIDYFGGSNYDTTMFPRVQQYEYVFYDNIDDIADVKPSEEGGGDEDEEYDPDAESEPTLEGTSRKLVELIYIPYITTDEVDDTFAVDTFFVGLKKDGGSDFSINITFDAIYNNDTIKATKKSLIFSTDYENVSNNRVVVSGTYDDTEHTLDGAMYTESEQEEIEKYSFGNAVLKDGRSVEGFISDSFKKENFTARHPDGTSHAYEIGRMCVYNNLYDSEFNLNFSKNILKFNFEYLTSSGSTLTNIPSMFLMYLTVEAM